MNSIENKIKELEQSISEGDVEINKMCNEIQPLLEKRDALINLIEIKRKLLQMMIDHPELFKN